MLTCSNLLHPSGCQHGAAHLTKRQIILGRVEQARARITKIAFQRQCARQAEAAGHAQRLVAGGTSGVGTQVFDGGDLRGDRCRLAGVTRTRAYCRYFGPNLGI